uniref:Uncharacterized protein n=1 Tax=Dulem virus 40 TaxID=3145758 RepID=A0AAU8AWE9_9CAUD
MNMEQLTPIQRIAYEAVCEITEAKQGVREPCVAHIREIRNSLDVEITEALRTLCRRGFLSVSLDVNKTPMFRITDTNP